MFTKMVTSASPSSTPRWTTPSLGSCLARDGTPPRMCGPSSSAWLASSTSPTLSGELPGRADDGTLLVLAVERLSDVQWEIEFGSYFISRYPFAALPMWTPAWCTEDSRRVKARTKNTKTSSGKQNTEPLKKMYTFLLTSKPCIFQETSDRFPCWGCQGPSGRSSYHGRVSYFMTKV